MERKEFALGSGSQFQNQLFFSEKKKRNVTNRPPP
jgi:hypothetical protein